MTSCGQRKRCHLLSEIETWTSEGQEVGTGVSVPAVSDPESAAHTVVLIPIPLASCTLGFVLCSTHSKKGHCGHLLKDAHGDNSSQPYFLSQREGITINLLCEAVRGEAHLPHPPNPHYWRLRAYWYLRVHVPTTHWQHTCTLPPSDLHHATYFTTYFPNPGSTSHSSTNLGG